MPAVPHDEWLRRTKAFQLSGGHHIDGAEEADRKSVV